MKLSRKTYYIIAGLIVLFCAAFIYQGLYFDAQTDKLAFRGYGPIRVGRLSEHLKQAVKEPLFLRSGEKEIRIEPEQLATWIEPYTRVFTGKQEYRANLIQLDKDLEILSVGFIIPPTDAEFGFQNGVIVETVPAQRGQELNIEASRQNILQAMMKNIPSADLVLKQTEPRLSLATLTDFGITTLIASGSSNFKGSSSSRVHNIKVGAKKMNHIIIPAGSEFSFNDNVGEIDAANGYEPGLVIKNGGLVPEYGGGICQVATTMFRAAFTSGFKIVERHNHSIPVHYYDPQGYDATIYPGVVDLRFVNNTPSNVLIQSHVVGNTISFEMYGVPDDRKVKITGPITYDYQPDGSLKAVLYRTVTLAGVEQKKETYYSSYRSPALYPVIKNPLE